VKKRLQENRHARSSACIQETNAEYFSCLLHLGGNAKRKEQSAKRKTNDFFSHRVSLFLLLFALCSLLPATI
jgi:hypothetical protein